MALKAPLPLIGEYKRVLLHVNAYKITFVGPELCYLVCKYRHTAGFRRLKLFGDCGECPTDEQGMSNEEVGLKTVFARELEKFRMGRTFRTDFLIGHSLFICWTFHKKTPRKRGFSKTNPLCLSKDCRYIRLLRFRGFLLFPCKHCIFQYLLQFHFHFGFVELELHAGERFSIQ
jgi:hypothetical protein